MRFFEHGSLLFLLLQAVLGINLQLFQKDSHVVGALTHQRWKTSVKSLRTLRFIRTLSMKITIIGAGNIAYFMAMRLQAAGHQILEVYARRKEAADPLAGLTGSRSVADIKQLHAADVFLFALPDGVLKAVSDAVPFKEGGVCLHCSGTQPVEVLDAADAGVLWPLYSINKAHLPEETNVPLFWEARGARALEVVPRLAADISTNVHAADWQKRQTLHLSAVFANNFVNHLMAIASQQMKDSGLPFRESLRPIIEETLRLALTEEASECQTGPAIRHDEQTMKRHLQQLSGHPEWQAVYQAISASIQQFYSSSKDYDQ